MSSTAEKTVPIKKKDEGEKRNKFVRLAEKRTSNAIRSIRVIGKLGNPAAYSYDESDIRKIAGALSREIEELKSRMMRKSGKGTVEFRL
jgi:hypothetical protein